MKHVLVVLLLSGSLAAQASPPTVNDGPKLQVGLWPGTGPATWSASQRLQLMVTIRHPLAGEAVEAPPFRLDPEGGYGAAVSLEVLDPDGRPVEWPLVRSWTPVQGQPSEANDFTPRPELDLHLHGRAQVMFTLASAPAGLRSGPHRIVARLESKTGAWRGAVQSAPFELMVAATIACELDAPAGDAVRGWPLRLSATVRRIEPGWRGVWRSPADLAARPALPKHWIIERVGPEGVGEPAGGLEALVATSVSEPDEVWALQLLVPAAATATLAAGSCRLRLVGDGGLASAAIGFLVVEPPAQPTPAQAVQQSEALMHEALARLLVLGTAAYDADGQPTPPARVLLQQAMAALAEARQHTPDDGRLLAMAVLLADRLGDDAAGAALRQAVSALGERSGEPEDAAAWLVADDGLPFAGSPTPPTAESVPPAPPVPEPPVPEPQAPPSAGPAPTRTPPVGEDPAPADPGATAVVRHASPVPAGDCKQQDAEFRADPLGQWAASATASSEYSKTSYSAQAATGAPDVEKYGDDVRAWAPSAADQGEETLTLQFPRPIRAAGVRIRQNLNPGRIQRVVVAGAAGTREVFVGPDRTVYPKDAIGWLVLTFSPTDFAVDRVVVVLDTKAGPGYEEIDAVQLVAVAGTGR